MYPISTIGISPRRATAPGAYFLPVAGRSGYETMIGQVESHRDKVGNLPYAVPQTSFLPRNQNGRLKFMSFSYEGEIAGC